MGAASVDRMQSDRRSKKRKRSLQKRLNVLREDAAMRLQDMQRRQREMDQVIRDCRESVPALDQIIKIRKLGFFGRMMWAVGFVLRGLPTEIEGQFTGEETR